MAYNLDQRYLQQNSIFYPSMYSQRENNINPYNINPNAIIP